MFPDDSILLKRGTESPWIGEILTDDFLDSAQTTDAREIHVCSRWRGPHRSRKCHRGLTCANPVALCAICTDSYRQLCLHRHSWNYYVCTSASLLFDTNRTGGARIWSCHYRPVDGSVRHCQRCLANDDFCAISRQIWFQDHFQVLRNVFHSHLRPIPDHQHRCTAIRNQLACLVFTHLFVAIGCFHGYVVRCAGFCMVISLLLLI